MTRRSRKIIVAITGASGAAYAERLLKRLSALEKPPAVIAVVLTDTAREIWEHETGRKVKLSKNLTEYDNKSFYAPFASGSSDYDTMIICPASMGSVGRIANGISDDLITRAADVILKERRKLIIVPREAPFNLIHLKNMEALTLAGAIICPASPSFYSKPETVEALIDTVIDRIISLADFEADTYRWMDNG